MPLLTKDIRFEAEEEVEEEAEEVTMAKMLTVVNMGMMVTMGNQDPEEEPLKR